MTEALFLKTGLINANAPLKNGLGRFIPQLMRITIKFCKESPHSTGVREFIEKDIVEFAKKNPGTAIYLKPRRHRTPVVVAEYLNGEKLWQGLNREDYDVVSEWIDYYKNHSGKNYLVQKKYEYTENPTIQGMWHPFVNVEPEIATAKFPVDELSKPFGLQKTASQHLKELFEQQKSQANISDSENDQLESTKQS